MNEPTTPARDTALAFLKQLNAGVLATSGHDNVPHATVVHFISDASFNIYFLTKKDSRKFAAIQAHPQVAFVVGRSDVPQSLQIEGVASEVLSDDTKEARISELMNILAQHVPGYVPLAKMDGEMTLMWLQPKWIRWADFSKPQIGNANMFTEIPVV